MKRILLLSTVVVLVLATSVLFYSRPLKNEVAPASVAKVEAPQEGPVLAIGSIVDCGYATPTTKDVVKAMQGAIMDGHNVFE